MGTKFVVEKIKIMLTVELIVTIGIKIFLFIIFPYYSKMGKTDPDRNHSWGSVAGIDFSFM